MAPRDLRNHLRSREQFARRRTLAVATIAAAGLAYVATASIGCNGILGIDERTLAPADDPLSCESYCVAVQAGCTGEFAQYQTREVCLSTCALLPLGTAADTSGNTVGCRLHNVQLATDTGERGDHCPIAGPAGGASCGDRCQNFCSVFVPSCIGLSAVADTESCLAFCASSIDHPEWNPLVPEELDHDDSIQCRIWHLANAAQSPDIHCGHADGTTKCELAGATSSSSSSSSGQGGAGGAETDGEGGAGG